MQSSKIFKPCELKEMERRENKDYSDKFGLFSGRIKPKIIEILEVWIPKKKDLRRLINPKRKIKTNGRG